MTAENAPSEPVDAGEPPTLMEPPSTHPADAEAICLWWSASGHDGIWMGWRRDGRVVLSERRGRECRSVTVSRDIWAQWLQALLNRNG